MGRGPCYTVIPNDWQNLEYIIADLSSRIINEDASFTDYILANGSRAFTGVVSGITPTADANLTTKDYVDTITSEGYVPYSGAVDDVDLGVHNLSTTGILKAGVAGLKILEGGSTPTLYGIFSVPDLSTADKTYTFPAVSGSVAYSIAGTYAAIDSYINQAVLTTSSPTFAGLTLEYEGSNYATFIIDYNVLTIGNIDTLVIDSHLKVTTGYLGLYRGGGYQLELGYTDDITCQLTTGSDGILKFNPSGNKIVAGLYGTSVDIEATGSLIASGLKILESGATPTKYSIFQGGDQAIDLTYTLPTAYPVSVSQVLQSTVAGVLSWVTPAASVSFSSTTQIPYMNEAGTDFLYSANLTFDGTNLTNSGIGAFNEVNIGTTGNTGTVLAVGTAVSNPAFTGLVEISAPSGTPFTTKSMLSLDGYRAPAGSSAFAFGIGDFYYPTGSSAGGNDVGLYGGVTGAVTYGSGTTTSLIGLYFGADNRADFTVTGVVTKTIQTQGLRVNNSLGYPGYTISGTAGKGIGYGGLFNASMAGTYNGGVAGLNYGIYAATIDSLTDASGNITSYGIYLKPCAGSTKAGLGVVTSYGLYCLTATGVTNVLESPTTIGAATAPTTSAVLDLASTTGALLVPRMTTTQKNALTPTNGFVVYDSSLTAFYFYENGAWVTK